MRSFPFTLPSSTAIACGSAVLLVPLAASGAVVGLPPAGAAASASASESTLPPVIASDASTTAADASAESTTSDEVRAAASAVRGGAIRSRSSVSAASGASDPSSASGSGAWTETLTTAGVDPVGQVPLLASIRIDGSFDYLNNNSGAGGGDIFADVEVSLTVHTDGGSTTIFAGSSSLSSPAMFPAVPDLVRTGDWADPARDGDFIATACGAFSCSYEVETNIEIPAGLVPFGEVFAIEFALSTSAGVHASREVEASSDFSNTATVVISTPLDGVVVRSVEIGSIPEPSRSLLAAGAIAVVGLRHRRSSRRRDPS